jgi:L-ribulose-5-phosphate 3-epimerase
MTRRDFLATVASTGPATLAAAPARPIVCFFSKHLQDFDYSRLGKALHEAGFAGVDLTVRAQGHVLPERVAEDLPRAYEAIRSHRVQVPMISTALTTTTDPAARPTVSTAGRLGITHFKLGYYRWGKDIGSTLAQVKSSLEGLVELAREYGVTAGFHNHVNYVGQAIWDVQPLLSELDAKRLGYYYDFHHAVSQGAGKGWEMTLQLASPRLRMVAVKDFNWSKSSGVWRPEPCALGEGAIDWARVFSTLASNGFAGPLSIHQEYKAADRVAAAHKDLEFVSRHIEKAYA